MQQMGEFLAQHATKEVLTVFGAIAATWVGYKAAKGSLGMIASVAKKASFMGLASALLLAVGLGSTGFGIGELRSRPTQPAIQTNGIGNAELLKIALTKDHNPETVKAILAYAEQRDGKKGKKVASVSEAKLVTFRIEGDKMIPVSTEQPEVKQEAQWPANNYDEDYAGVTIDPVKESAVKAEESVVSIPIAWSLMGLGLAASLSGFAVFANRHNQRNIADPHHPQYRA